MAIKSKNIYKSDDVKPFKLSRSKVVLFSVKHRVFATEQVKENHKIMVSTR